MQSPNGASNQEQHLRAQLELLQNHDAEATASRDHQTTSDQAANGYEQLQIASQDAIRAIASKAAGEAHIHPDLRASPTHGHSPMMLSPTDPSAQHQAGPMPSGSAMEVDRKPKRELSQSKRAAQNRAAQRAFRQRKEGYIKKLESQVREFLEMENSFKQLQSENYALREYVIHLQSRLLDTQGEVPPPPPNVNLSQQSHTGEHSHLGEAGPSDGAGTPLEAVAQAVAGLAAQEQLNEERHSSYLGLKTERIDEDTRSPDEINRVLASDETPA